MVLYINTFRGLLKVVDRALSQKQIKANCWVGAAILSIRLNGYNYPKITNYHI